MLLAMVCCNLDKSSNVSALNWHIKPKIHVHRTVRANPWPPTIAYQLPHGQFHTKLGMLEVALEKSQGGPSPVSLNGISNSTLLTTGVCVLYYYNICIHFQTSSEDIDVIANVYSGWLQHVHHFWLHSCFPREPSTGWAILYHNHLTAKWLDVHVQHCRRWTKAEK